MSGFAALLKLSQTQTAQSELEVQAQIANHQLQLERKRRELEAKERKEREVETKLRARRFEEQRKEEERKRKRAEEESAREREFAKREEQMRHALKYGPRKSSTAASGSSKARRRDLGGESGLTREELRKRPKESEFSTLTREEKRELKLAAELKKGSSSSSRRTGGAPHRTASLPNGRTVRRLPGGAVDYTTVSRLADPDAPLAIPLGNLAGKSTRERLAAMPSTLLKLNTIKRDVRTIDEILIDRAKAKQSTVLAGDDAREFSDWFGKNKKKEKAASQLAIRKRPAPFVSSPALTTTPSGSPAPTINPSSGTAVPKAMTAALTTPSKTSIPFLKPINPKPSTVSHPPGTPLSSPSSKKRPRSPDSDTALPSAKRRLSASSRPAAAPSRPVTSSRPSAPSTRQPTSSVDITTEIWSIFGKDKKSYVARDVWSDDEDMEADAQSVLKEEARSARLAHKEDEHALAEERRHEEEKRRRKKERERREKS